MGGVKLGGKLHTLVLVFLVWGVVSAIVELFFAGSPLAVVF